MRLNSVVFSTKEQFRKKGINYSVYLIIRQNADMTFSSSISTHINGVEKPKITLDELIDFVTSKLEKYQISEYFYKNFNSQTNFYGHRVKKTRLVNFLINSIPNYFEQQK